jgi:hypothetical protein
MSKTVAMVQSNYIPWKGYFDMINMADLFVFYDDVAFTKDDWRNRNRIKTKDGLQWLTVPCGPPRGRLICEVEIRDDGWQHKHWSRIQHAYARARYYDLYRERFEERYLGRRWRTLSELNQELIQWIAHGLLGIDTEFGDSRDYAIAPDKTRESRWIEILQRIGTDRFIIGPSARNYLDPPKEAEVARAGIELVWMDYSNYPEYGQLFPPFAHEVSIIDLIFNEGPDAPRYMKSFR